MNVTPPTKVLLLEIDAGDRDLILQWAEEGSLPTIHRLLKQGLFGQTMAVPGFYVGSIWPSFYTGVNPARHGIHSLAQLRTGSYEIFRCLTGDHIQCEPFWNYLSRAGKRVAILDIPLSGISPNLNGIQMVEWGSHDSNYGFKTWPPALAKEVKARFGLHPQIDSCNANRRTAEEFIALKNALVKGVQKKAALTRHYLSRGGWDFFAQVFTESHCVGHQCWHLHDPNHPSHQPELAAATGDPIKEVYKAIDTAIGDVLAEAGADTKTLVLAGHGMSSKRGTQFLLHEILVRLNVAAPAAPKPAAPPSFIDRLDSFLTWSWQQIPGSVKRTLQPARDQLRSWIDAPHSFPPPKLEPAKSKCFLIENGFAVGGIRLNLIGREPMGVISPGSQADAFCQELTRDLLDITELNTGKHLVNRVMRTDDLYQGKELSRLPDLLVEWSPDVPLGTDIVGRPGSGTMEITSPKIGVIRGINQYCRTGEHRPEGMFIACGPGIAPGRIEHTASIMDFAPTLTKMLGVDLPDSDGKPIAEVLG